MPADRGGMRWPNLPAVIQNRRLRKIQCGRSGCFQSATPRRNDHSGNDRILGMLHLTHLQDCYLLNTGI